MNYNYMLNLRFKKIQKGMKLAMYYSKYGYTVNAILWREWE